MGPSHLSCEYIHYALLMWPLCVRGFVCVYVEKHYKNIWGKLEKFDGSDALRGGGCSLCLRPLGGDNESVKWFLD